MRALKHKKGVTGRYYRERSSPMFITWRSTVQRFFLVDLSMTSSSDDLRLHRLTEWLASCPPEWGLSLQSLAPASADASFRRYFRLNATGPSLVVMDAPPQTEDCRPFIDVSARLAAKGLNVPKILAQNLEQGFLLLTDLGPTTYYSLIQTEPSNKALQTIYREAISALVTMQQADATGLPNYDATRLKTELGLFPEWYVGVHCKHALSAEQAKILEQVFDLLVSHNAAQPSVLVHRDFHSPNLMYCDKPEYGTNPGILDYQDAVKGPITYDLASLVMDARTTWEEPQQLDWAIRYWELARKNNLPVPADFADFHRDYEWMGLQRNLRILGVFARLNYRDGKSHYLAHIPRVNQYVRQVAGRYNVFRPLIKILDTLDNIQPSVGYTF